VPADSAARSGPGVHAIEFEISLQGGAVDAPVARSVEKSTFVVPR
jgi:hypothetical protein